MVKKITKWLYLEPLLFEREWIHLSKISELVGKNHTVVRQYMGEFEKRGIIIKKTVGRLSMYKLKLDYPFIYEIISLIEGEKVLFRSGDLRLKEIYSILRGIKGVIFGSYVKTSREANDIDILLFGKNKGVNEKIKEIEKKINKKIHLIEVKNLSEVNEGLRREVMKKHLIISGGDEVIRWLI